MANPTNAFNLISKSRLSLTTTDSDISKNRDQQLVDNKLYQAKTSSAVFNIFDSIFGRKIGFSLYFKRFSSSIDFQVIGKVCQ